MADKGTKDGPSVHRMVDAVAHKQGWVPNPDGEFRGTIEAGLLKTWNRHGYYLCPCRDGDGDRETDKDIICPCVYAKADIDEFGHCFCGLYLSKDHVAAHRNVRQIPERRSGF